MQALFVYGIDILAADADAAAVDIVKALQDRCEGGLARARSADHTKCAAARQGKADVREVILFAVVGEASPDCPPLSSPTA